MKGQMRQAARRALALALALLLALGGPLQQAALAEASDDAGRYLAEVRVGVAGTADEAAKALEADGWTVLRADGKPADLNQGAGAAVKQDRAVVLGYRTTAEAGKALTDLAVMNMSGGYSFSDYAQLMEKYRDGQVRPFVERFMSTVAEYRANAASENPGNRARGDIARALLNRIVDDDTGGGLGDLLLERTKAEMGDAYESLPEDEARRHIDLETALMQGDSSMVVTAERLLALAADSSETTWLERLSALGPDGLYAQSGADRPADAEAELAASYQDLAARLADGWEEVRAALLAQDGVVALEGDEATAAQDGVVAVEGDEADASDLVTLEPAELPEEVDAGDLTAEDAPQVVADVGESMGAMAESAESVADARDAAIAAYLRAKPYGDGTLFDLFTRPAAEVTGDGIAALYPAASCLSEGQAAAIGFLSLTDLLQVGSTTGEALAQAWAGDGALARTAEAAPQVSLYEGVDREIFSEVTALTSDALRAEALRAQDAGAMDFLSTYRRSALLWAGSAIAAIAAGVSAYKEARFFAQAAEKGSGISKNLTTVANHVEARLVGMQQDLNRMRDRVLSSGKYNEIGEFSVTKMGSGYGPGAYKITMTPKAPAELLSRYNELKKTVNSLKLDASVKGMTPGGPNELLLVEAQKEFAQAKEQLSNFYTDNAISDFTYGPNIDWSTTEGFKGSVDDYMDLVRQRSDDFLEAQRVRGEVLVGDVKASSTRWTTVSNIAGVVFFLLTVASVVSTVYDVVSYYNVSYAPVPGYIVDVSDITRTEEDGTTTVVRNDRAYYRAATTDARREGEDLVAMGDYADLNGDAGKEWLALYTASREGQAPILADSLRVVVGSASVPDGYATGVHAFGSDAAANLTDARYTYNDDANGIYAYFRREETPAAPAAGSAFAGGTAALAGGAGLVAGAAIGAGVTAYAGRRHREAEA